MVETLILSHTAFLFEIQFVFSLKKIFFRRSVESSRERVLTRQLLARDDRILALRYKGLARGF